MLSKGISSDEGSAYVRLFKQINDDDQEAENLLNQATLANENFQSDSVDDKHLDALIYESTQIQFSDLFGYGIKNEKDVHDDITVIDDCDEYDFGENA